MELKKKKKAQSLRLSIDNSYWTNTPEERFYFTNPGCLKKQTMKTKPRSAIVVVLGLFLW